MFPLRKDPDDTGFAVVSRLADDPAAPDAVHSFTEKGRLTPDLVQRGLEQEGELGAEAVDGPGIFPHDLSGARSDPEQFPQHLGERDEAEELRVSSLYTGCSRSASSITR